MAKIDRMLVGESLVGDGNEVAHIDLLIGPRGSAAETAFANSLTNNKDGFTSLLAVVAPNLLCKPATVMFNKVTIKGAKQAVQMFGPAQRGVAMAVADCVEDGTIPADEADNLFISVGVFIHWMAEDDKKIQDYNYQAVKESIKRDEIAALTALSGDSVITRAEAARLRNENLTLHKQMEERAASRTALEKLEAMNARKAGSKKTGQTYVVQSGDTLFSISRKFYKSTKRWKAILEANKKDIRSPKDLTVGQTLVIP